MSKDYILERLIMLMSMEKDMLTKINLRDIIEKVAAQNDRYKKKCINYD